MLIMLHVLIVRHMVDCGTMRVDQDQKHDQVS